MFLLCKVIIKHIYYIYYKKNILSRSYDLVLDSSRLLIVVSLTVKAATLIFTYGRGSAYSSAKQGK